MLTDFLHMSSLPFSASQKYHDDDDGDTYPPTYIPTFDNDISTLSLIDAD